jgi:5'-nucleotidase
MKILLTNDDGIFSEGIQVLKRELTKIGEVVVIAPECERSAVGHSLTLHKPLRIKPIFIKDENFGYAVNGTPTDCVVLGLKFIFKKKKPDLIISGINRGANLGGDLTYSGTVSAAMEGAIHKIPSFAVSIASREAKDFSFASKFSRELAKIVAKNKLPPFSFLNINIPAVKEEEIKGIEITYQSDRCYIGTVEERKDPRGKYYYWIGGTFPKNKAKKGTDVYAIINNKISITPIQLNLTNYKLYEKIKKWDLKNVYSILHKSL